MAEQINDKKDNYVVDEGEIRIADDVVEVVAGIAATKVEGVAGMSGNVVGDIGEMLGRKNLGKGVKVEIKDEGAKISLYIMVDYGIRIPDVALKVQESVKDAIETMTGMEILEINVHVQDIIFPDEKKM